MGLLRRVGLACALLLVGAAAAHAQPTVRSVGAVAAGGAAVTPGMPSGAAVGDLLLMFCETAGGQAIDSATATNWESTGATTEGTCGSETFVQTGTSSVTDTRLTVLYRIATSGDVDGTCETCTTTDSGNHQICRIIAVTVGTFNSSDPFDVVDCNTQTATTSISINGATATTANSLVFAASVGAIDPSATDGNGFSSWTNANLSSLTERIDNRDQIQNGGYLGVATGVRATATDWGATTATGAESTIWANMSFNVNAAPNTPTATATHTPTRTNTATHTATATATPTNTDTPTAAAGCGYTDYTPAADADDGRIYRIGTSGSEWPPTGAVTADTSGTMGDAGRYVFGITINAEMVAVFNTADLGAAGRSAVGAALTVNLTAVTGNAARNVVGEWTSAGNDGWTSADYVQDVGTTALNYATSATPRVGLWSFTLSNPGSINASGKTGIMLGLDGGTPTSNPAQLQIETRENAGTNPPKLRVYWCANTPTVTATATATATATGTATNTASPTAPAGCAYYRVTSDTDDAYIVGSAASYPPTSGTTLFNSGALHDISRSVFAGPSYYTQLAALRFDTGALDLPTWSASGAWLDLYHTSYATSADSRSLVLDWYAAETPPGLDDWTNTAGTSAHAGTALTSLTLNHYWRYALLDPAANVDLSSYTGLKVAVDGGAPAGINRTAFYSSDEADKQPALLVLACPPTSTATPTNTATPLPTSTWTLPPDRARCPDRDGDGLCGVAILGSERTKNALWPTLQWLIPDADMICDWTTAGTTSPEMADQQEALSTPGPTMGTCTEGGGTVLRGADIFADVVLIDVASVYDYVYTTTAPRAGTCWGPGNACRVEAEYGFVGSHATDVHAKCVGGPDYRTPCVPKPFGTPTPCAHDPAPNDPYASYCQPWVFADGEAGVDVLGCPQGMCQQRSNLHSVYRNLRRIVDVARLRRAVPVLLFNVLPASWQNSRNATGVRTTPLPDGTPYPSSAYQAEHEVAAPDLRVIRGWMRAYADEATSGPIAFVDLQRAAELDTAGRWWRWLGDQSDLVTAAAVGHCTCVTDADCGAGGTCTNNLYCTAGERATCSRPDDPVCRGSDSQQHPGHAWCIAADDFDAAYAVHACIEDLATDQQPEWEADEPPILLCSDPRIPRPPQWTPWPTHTVPFTPTATGTATRTGTATATPTGPTPTQTRTPQSLTPAAFSASCSADAHGAGNPKACDKLGTLFRHHRDWAGRIGSIDSNSNYGYALGDCATMPSGICKIHPSLGTAFNASPYRFLASTEMPNQLRCADVDMTGQGGCTNDITRDLGHLGDYKWLYQDECTMSDAESEWRWMGSPPLLISSGQSPNVGGPTLALSQDCDTTKYVAETGQAWEWARCHQEVFIMPQLLDTLDRLRAYGRCSVATTAYYESSPTAKPCSSDADCTAIGGGVCNNANNGTYPNGYLSHDCAAKTWNLIYNDISQYVIQNGCTGGEQATYCENKGWYKPYQSWDAAAMQSACGTGTGTFSLAVQGSKTTNPFTSTVPTCPVNPTGGGKSYLDCKTYFDWVESTIDRILPIIYGCREQAPGPAVWAPHWCSVYTNKQCQTDADCGSSGGSCI